MSSEDRMRREDPERDAPRRSWFEGFDRQQPPSNGQSEAGGTANSAAGWQNAVEQSVRMGYEVIDAQIKEGRRVAEQLSGQMSSGGGAYGSDSIRGMTDGFFRSFADLTTRWLEVMSASTTGMAGPGSNASANHGSEQPSQNGVASASSSSSVPVAIEVDSKRPTTVTLDLRPGSQARALGNQPLSDPDPDKPPLRDVLFEPPGDDSPLTIKIRVPESHPAGVFSAVVFEREGGQPQGTLSVAITDPPPSENSA